MIIKLEKLNGQLISEMTTDPMTLTDGEFYWIELDQSEEFIAAQSLMGELWIGGKKASEIANHTIFVINHIPKPTVQHKRYPH